MVKTVQDIIIRPIEIVDQPEETTDGKILSIWLLVPAILVVAVSIFFVVSRILNKDA